MLAMLPLSHSSGACGVVTRESLLGPRPWESGSFAGFATALQRLQSVARPERVRCGGKTLASTDDLGIVSRSRAICF
jgi:hypothetical protein